MNTETGEVTAAQNLIGKILNNKWKVKSEFSTDSTTGGFFSCTYLVDDGVNEAFCKAIDMESFFHQYDGDMMTALNKMTDAFNFERDLLNLCRDRRLRKVAMILDDGQIRMPGHNIPVPFLIFELANGDARSHLGETLDKISVAWKLKSLHDIAVGIMQLNSIDVSHQDLKPSNILVFDNNISKVGDIGRAMCKGELTAPHDDGRIYSGHSNYAPPEIYYGYTQDDWRERNFSIDNYQLGSLIVFYFSYHTMTALTFSNLAEEFQYYNWKSTYPAVQPYIVDAFYNALEQFGQEIADVQLREELCSLVKQLCHPNPSLRGHVLNNQSIHCNKYDLRRVVSKLDILYQKAKFNIIK